MLNKKPILIVTGCAIAIVIGAYLFGHLYFIKSTETAKPGPTAKGHWHGDVWHDETTVDSEPKPEKTASSLSATSTEKPSLLATEQPDSSIVGAKEIGGTSNESDRFLSEAEVQALMGGIQDYARGLLNQYPMLQKSEEELMNLVSTSQGTLELQRELKAFSELIMDKTAEVLAKIPTQQREALLEDSFSTALTLGVPMPEEYVDQTFKVLRQKIKEKENR